WRAGRSGGFRRRSPPDPRRGGERSFLRFVRPADHRQRHGSGNQGVQETMSLKAACITFPGSNCDQDIHRAVNLMGWDLVKVWHSNTLEEKVDVIFVPGGFSYGDYLRCGALARFSQAMTSVRDHAA